MPTRASNNRCTVGLLLNAAFVAYDYHRSQFKNTALVECDPKVSNAINEQGYYPVLTSLNLGEKALKSNLGAIVFAPTDKQGNEPIVIAYRGTSDLYDARTDANLTITGTTGRNYQEEAYLIYQKIRRQYPDKEIVFTGHSLGGHLAQFVAARAFVANHDNNFEVRTFNTAAIDSRDSRIVNQDPIQNRFVHYRLENDPVSMVQQRIGNTFSLPAPHLGYSSSHQLSALQSSIPQAILSLPIGGRDPVQSLREKILGLGACYQCRINGQYFSWARKGKNKNDVFQATIKRLIDELSNDSLNMETKRQKMLEHLHTCKDKLQQYGKGTLDHLLHELDYDINAIKLSTSQTSSVHKYKEILQDTRTEVDNEASFPSSSPKK